MDIFHIFFLFVAVFAITMAEELQIEISSETVIDVDPDTPGDQLGAILTITTEGEGELTADHFIVIDVPYADYTGFKKFEKVDDNTYKMTIGVILPPDEETPPPEASGESTPPPESSNENIPAVRSLRGNVPTQNPPVQQPEDAQQSANNSGGGDSTQPVKPEEPVNHTIKPFDYEGEGVGKVVLSEWMMSKLDSAPQWIELYNTTDESITLQGWQLVGRAMNSDGKVSVLKTRTLPTLTLKSKETCVIVTFPVRSSQYYSPNLRRRIYSLRASNEWSSQGIVLELQDEYGTPIDRIGNLSDQDEVRWDIPDRIHQSVGSNGKRVSFIRRLRSQKSREYNFRFGMTKFGWFAADEVEKLTKNKRSKYFYGHPTDIGTPGYRTEGADPLPVTLSSFIAQVAEGGQVVLSWTTASEIENAGFNIFRSEGKAGTFVKVNARLIQGAGTTSDRNEYTWIDTTAKPNVAYYYQIEDISFSGVKQTLATKRMKGIHTAKNRHLTSWGILKKEWNK